MVNSGWCSGAALAIAEHAGEGEHPRLAGGQQLLAGELRRGVQVARRALAARADKLGRERVQMGLVAGRDLQRRGLDLEEAAAAKPVPQRRQDAPARQQERPPVGVDVAVPPGRGVRSRRPHLLSEKAGEAGQDQYGAARNRGARPRQPQKEYASVKVIASSLRKGNILDIDDKLYVVLHAESFHPGKGTPTTQVDMRRISDGVKVSQRYKTTEQVERAHVEDREFTFLYSDGEGFHFMNSETYDQITLQADLVGDQARLSAAGDEGDAQRARGHAGGDRAAAEGGPRGGGDRAGHQGPDRVVVLQARQAVERRAHQRCRRSSAPARASW